MNNVKEPVFPVTKRMVFFKCKIFYDSFNTFIRVNKEKS
jgi:hypothetical protein